MVIDELLYPNVSIEYILENKKLYNETFFFTKQLGKYLKKKREGRTKLKINKHSNYIKNLLLDKYFMINDLVKIINDYVTDNIIIVKDSIPKHHTSSTCRNRANVGGEPPFKMTFVSYIFFPFFELLHVVLYCSFFDLTPEYSKRVPRC